MIGVLSHDIVIEDTTNVSEETQQVLQEYLAEELPLYEKRFCSYRMGAIVNDQIFIDEKGANFNDHKNYLVGTDTWMEEEKCTIKYSVYKVAENIRQAFFAFRVTEEHIRKGKQHNPYKIFKEYLDQTGDYVLEKHSATVTYNLNLEDVEAYNRAAKFLRAYGDPPYKNWHRCESRPTFLKSAVTYLGNGTTIN